MLPAMLLFAVSLSLLFAGGESAANVPTPCCFSHQFSTTIGHFGGTVVSGHGVGIEGYETLMFDYDAKLLYVDSHMRDPDTGNYVDTKILRDYNTQKEYITTAQGRCYYTDITHSMLEPCIPENATYTHEMTFGFGSETLETYLWKYAEPTGQLKVWLAVTKDGCIPVVEGTAGEPDGSKTDNVMFFTHFRPSITDRSVFAVPTDCNTPLPHGQGSPSPIGKRSAVFQ